jgi:hypothetical protein
MGRVRSKKVSENNVSIKIKIIKYNNNKINNNVNNLLLLSPKLALTSPTSVGSSVGIVRSLTQATELLVLTVSC